MEEFPNGIGGVVSGWSITASSQRFALQSSFYFSYSATGPVSTTGTVAYATVISGILTVLNTSAPNVYSVIGMVATRQTTNFGGSVASTPLTLVGAMMAGNNNNLLYLNSATWPQGMDNQGWGYTSNASTLFPSSAATSATLPANSYIQLVNGVVEASTQQSVIYSNPTVSFTAYSSTASPPTAPSLPTNPVVVNSPSNPSNPSTTPSSTGSSAATGSTAGQTVIYTSSSSNDSNLSKGAIAGIVIGCSIGFGLLCALCTLFLATRTRRRDHGKPMKAQYDANSEHSKVEGATEDSRRGELELH